MFTFNRNEQIAILALTALLIVGSVVSAYDYFFPDDIENFEVIKGAIPVPEIPPEDEATHSEPLAVNVNTATLEELQSLPGVGASRAQAILNEREARGGFRSVDDLLDVKGIGPSGLERLRPHARTSGPTRVPSGDSGEAP